MRDKKTILLYMYIKTNYECRPGSSPGYELRIKKESGLKSQKKGARSDKKNNMQFISHLPGSGQSLNPS